MVANVVLPSLNVRVPVAVEGVTLAEKVTAEPYVDGSTDDDKPEVVVALFMV
jgi:hypothetical protein